jgi:hypothetical protein
MTLTINYQNFILRIKIVKIGIIFTKPYFKFKFKFKSLKLHMLLLKLEIMQTNHKNYTELT